MRNILSEKVASEVCNFCDDTNPSQVLALVNHFFFSYHSESSNGAVSIPKAQFDAILSLNRMLMTLGEEKNRKGLVQNR